MTRSEEDNLRGFIAQARSVECAALAAYEAAKMARQDAEARLQRHVSEPVPESPEACRARLDALVKAMS